MNTPARLVVVMTYDADPETGELIASSEPTQLDSSERAIGIAQGLVDKHAGVIAWARTAAPDLGEYGEPDILFQAGEIGYLE